MGRQKLCGSAIVLPTYPAWTFGKKYPAEQASEGPGTGKYAGAADSWAGASTRFGGPPQPVRGPWQYQSAPATGTQYLQPDYLSHNPKGPSHSFGQKTVAGPAEAPFNPPNVSTFAAFKQSHGSWGPPPRPRTAPPPRTPPPATPERRQRPKPTSALPGASFKGPYAPPRAAASPGPAAYQPCCGAHCCDACNKYKGWSFGHRHPGPAPSDGPAPHDYHVACVTLGAAAASCTDANGDASMYRHKPGRQDHHHHRHRV